MSAHIPEFRRAINGRTFDREWRPEAIERHTVRSEYRMCIGFVAFVLLIVFGGSLVARYFGG